MAPVKTKHESLLSLFIYFIFKHGYFLILTKYLMKGVLYKRSNTALTFLYSGISRMEDSLTESSTTPVSYTPRSTYSVTTPITTTASSTPGTPTPSPCQDPTQINSFILPCTGPMIFYLTSAKNETTYCG